MKKSLGSFMFAAVISIFILPAFAGDATNLGNDIFKVYVDSMEINASFPAYPDHNPPFLDKKTVDIKAKEGNILVKLKIVIDNITDTKQPFKLGDIQLINGNKKLSFIAAGLSVHPFIIKAKDYKKEKNVVKEVESRKTTTGGSYRFPIYIFEVPQNNQALKIRYKNTKWVELKEIKVNNQ
ncbi:MAG: hypothetical protein ABIK92_19875 [Pseudomonadota bacterium]